jgi:hypothetical protein
LFLLLILLILLILGRIEIIGDAFALSIASDAPHFFPNAFLFVSAKGIFVTTDVTQDGIKFVMDGVKSRHGRFPGSIGKL